MRRQRAAGLSQPRYYKPPSFSATLLSLFAIIGSGLDEKSRLAHAAQCSATPTTAIRVENATSAETLRAAANCSDGGQLDAVWVGSVSVPSTIVIAANTFLTVTGQDGAEAFGSFGTRVFEVSPGGGLQVFGLRLSGGTEVTGGAIYSSSGSLRLDKCVVDDNFASGGAGGALWAEGGNVTIVGGEFLNNGATSQGGAVFAVNCDLTVKDGTRFVSNAASEGGAVYCASSDSSSGKKTCFFDGVVFTKNNASSETLVNYDDYKAEWVGKSGGGALSVLRVDIKVADCTFESNFAQVAGGALFAGNHTELTVDACTFSNNTGLGFGAAMAVSTATITGGTVIEYGYTDGYGGGVSVFFLWGWSGGGGGGVREVTVEARNGYIFAASLAVIEATSHIYRV